VTAIADSVARSRLGPAGSPQESNRIPHERRWWALAASLGAVFVVSINWTIVTTAAPSIVVDLHGFSAYGWLFAANGLASTVAVAFSGKLSDVYGRRPFFVLGSLVFVLGVLVSGLAPTMGVMIVGRVLAGLGGGAANTVSSVLIADIFGIEEMARWYGVWMASFGAGSILGPIVGGAITDAYGWRWIFLGSVPLGIAMFVLGWLALPRVRAPRSVRIDWLGIGTLVPGLVALLLAFTWGGQAYRWGSWQELVTIAAGVALLVAFVLVERRAADPVLMPEILRHRLFAAVALIGLLIMVSQAAVVTFAPLFVQGVIGETARSSGIVLVPLLVAQVVAAIVVTRLTGRLGGQRPVILSGIAVMAAALVLFVLLNPSSDNADVTIALVVFGLGIGISMPLVVVALQSAFPHRLLGAVNSGRMLFMNIGGAIGVSLLSAVAVGGFGPALDRNTPAAARNLLADSSLDPRSLLTPESSARIHHDLASLPSGESVYVAFVNGFHHALDTALSRVWAIALGTSLVALAVAAARLRSADMPPRRR
jgi:EmrB/QacA subfamily drug resistance transporter